MISGLIFGFCSLIFIVIGISQILTKTPVTFYSGEEPFKPEEITDIKAWNKSHGLMWILYGISITLTWFIGYKYFKSYWLLVPFFMGTIVPLFIMPLYHERLIKKYQKRNDENSQLKKINLV